MWRSGDIWRITAVVICLMAAVIAGLFVWGTVNTDSASKANSESTPVMYQEKSMPIQPSGAIPDTDSNDEGMQDMEEPTVISLRFN